MTGSDSGLIDSNGGKGSVRAAHPGTLTWTGTEPTLAGVVHSLTEKRTRNLTSSRIESPCIGVCQLDQDNVCVGCLRTLSEISLWSRLSSLQKAAIMLEIKSREERLNKVSNSSG